VERDRASRWRAGAIRRLQLGKLGARLCRIGRGRRGKNVRRIEILWREHYRLGRCRGGEQDECGEGGQPQRAHSLIVTSPVIWRPGWKKYWVPEMLMIRRESNRSLALIPTLMRPKS
jgi:hypothetical protein